MKILVFTEGTILMHAAAQGKTREEIVKQSRDFGVQMEGALLTLLGKASYGKDPNGIHNYTGYVPIGKSTEKIYDWKQRGANIYYLTSRRIKTEVDAIQNVLIKYGFPDSQNLLFRQKGQKYSDVAEKLMPDVLLEDDCESIGGKIQMTYTKIKPKLKPKIHSIVVKEFQGIDRLPKSISDLLAIQN